MAKRKPKKVHIAHELLHMPDTAGVYELSRKQSGPDEVMYRDPDELRDGIREAYKRRNIKFKELLRKCDTGYMVDRTLAQLATELRGDVEVVQRYSKAIDNAYRLLGETSYRTDLDG